VVDYAHVQFTDFHIQIEKPTVMGVGCTLDPAPVHPSKVDRHVARLGFILMVERIYAHAPAHVVRPMSHFFKLGFFSFL
jgi:hypothetical protein